jgi:hypothetical protein
MNAPPPNPKGQLMVMADAAKRGSMSVSTLRALLYAGMGPPAFKRPGSNRWLFYASEFDAWLEQGRRSAAG